MSNEFCVRVYHIEPTPKSRSMWASCQ